MPRIIPWSRQARGAAQSSERDEIKNEKEQESFSFLKRSRFERRNNFRARDPKGNYYNPKRGQIKISTATVPRQNECKTQATSSGRYVLREKRRRPALDLKKSVSFRSKFRPKFWLLSDFEKEGELVFLTWFVFLGRGFFSAFSCLLLFTKARSARGRQRPLRRALRCRRRQCRRRRHCNQKRRSLHRRRPRRRFLVPPRSLGCSRRRRRRVRQQQQQQQRRQQH